MCMYPERCEFERLAAEIDPSLTLGDMLSDGPTVIFLAESSGTPYVLKFGSLEKFWTRLHMKQEASALRAFSDIPNIAHLVEDVGPIGTYHALVKEYIPGQTLCDLNVAKISDVDKIYCLVETVAAIHDKGYAGLDVAHRNILVPQAGFKDDAHPCYLFDFGDCQHKSAFSGEHMFATEKQIDREYLGGLITGCLDDYDSGCRYD